MSESKWTPGPWEPYIPGRKFVVPVRNFNSICELNAFERDAAVVDANARLIAAAPDLYEACLEAIRTINAHSTEPIPVGVYSRVARILGDALSKAEGP
jgi:hypothetical protein